MRLFEFEVKNLFREYGIPTPTGCVVHTPQQAMEAFEKQKNPVVLKCQVLTGGRGKAGGIKFCSTADQVLQETPKLLKSTILDKKVERLLVEEKIPVKEEYYLGITFDPRAGLPILLMTSKGGMDIEEIPPSLVFSEIIDPLEGVPPFKARALAKKASFPPELYARLGDVASRLYTLFVDKDVIVLEINPLVLTAQGELIAADGKMDVDEDALYRHPEWEGRPFDGTDLEARAYQKDLRFVELEGNIGICGNGAGMMMTLEGHNPALDLEEEQSSGGETRFFSFSPTPE
jgi:succinyl-CoA synthetase beta subunit